MPNNRNAPSDNRTIVLQRHVLEVTGGNGDDIT